jgi:hypothetical protein
MPQKDYPMTKTTIGTITLAYRGETQQFTTVSLATHYLRQERVKVGWFHKITADVALMIDDEVRQIRHLKGDKFLIMQQLTQLEADLKQSRTSRS